MQERNLRRLVVVDERGRIAGIVSRSDLLQVFLRTDDELREEIRGELIPSLLMSTPEAIDVEVRWNVVTFSGESSRRSRGRDSDTGWPGEARWRGGRCRRADVTGGTTRPRRSGGTCVTQQRHCRGHLNYLASEAQEGHQKRDGSFGPRAKRLAGTRGLRSAM